MLEECYGESLCNEGGVCVFVCVYVCARGSSVNVGEDI
jgi:hypothetical protein